ncbi:MAG: hypothetical protein R3B74_11650 [Nitrospirales bacterium]|nr:hypothetical protein [Nitrospirales bacterium]
MPKTRAPIELNDEPGTWIFRDIPRDVMRRAKAAAAIQGKSVRQLTIDLMEEHLQELDKKGILPKGK